MRFIVHFHGSPIKECESVVAAYMFIRDEYKRRWPRAIYGPNEAKLHGLEVIGKPYLSREEERELEKAQRRYANG